MRLQTGPGIVFFSNAYLNGSYVSAEGCGCGSVHVQRQLSAAIAAVTMRQFCFIGFSGG